MAVNLGARPPADFSQPIEMMKDCYRRIEHFLNVLRKVVQRYGEGHLDEEGRRALETSLNYFAHFAPRHTADEERSLFPRLRRNERMEARAAMADLDQLERDHRRGENCHALIDELARQWLETGRLDEAPRKILTATLDVLTAMYAEHIRLEEQRVFVVANEVLQTKMLHAIGEEMKARRSLARLSPELAGGHIR